MHVFYFRAIVYLYCYCISCCTLVISSVVLKLCLSGSPTKHAPLRAEQPLTHVALATFGDPDDEHW